MNEAKINLNKLSSAIVAMRSCIEKNNQEWAGRHEETITKFEKMLPSGSGLDSGCSFDLSKCDGHKITVMADFHHLNDGGYYDGWTSHAIVITPSFGGFDIRVTGRDRDMIKDYLTDLFSEVFE